MMSFTRSRYSASVQSAAQAPMDRPRLYSRQGRRSGSGRSSDRQTRRGKYRSARRMRERMFPALTKGPR